MKIRSCRFERAATRPQDEPRTPGPDVVFLGRSNVGKSSLINRLLGVRSLARTSSRPGRTRAVHFYRINETFHFVDLPGYGYASAPRSEREAWGPMVESLLDRRRERIALALLLVDARHRSELDRTMKDWLEWREMSYVIAVTKADKLSAAARSRVLREVGTHLACAEDEARTVLASARTGLGIRQLWRHLDGAVREWREPAARGRIEAS